MIRLLLPVRHDWGNGFGRKESEVVLCNYEWNVILWDL